MLYTALHATKAKEQYLLAGQGRFTTALSAARSVYIKYGNLARACKIEFKYEKKTNE